MRLISLAGRLLLWAVGLLFVLIVVVFAVANRQAATLELWPLPWSVDIPIYLAVLAPLVLGLAIGLVVALVSSLGVRRRAAREKRRADRLAQQLDAMTNQAPPPQQTLLPPGSPY